MAGTTTLDINFVTDVAMDILGHAISAEEAQVAYDAIAKTYNPKSADFYYELKHYFID